MFIFDRSTPTRRNDGQRRKDISITGISDDTGAVGDATTSDATLIIGGTAEAGSSVAVLVDGASIGTTTTDGSGNWSFDYRGPL